MKHIKPQVLKNYLDEYTKEELALGLIAHVCKQREDAIEIAWLNECVEILTDGAYEKDEELNLYKEMRQQQSATQSQYYTES